MYKDKTQIVKSDKYLDWLVNFTEKFPSRCWDSETSYIQNSRISDYDYQNILLLSRFIDYVQTLAKKQYVVSLPNNKASTFRCNIKLRGNFYEVSIVGYSCINVFKKVFEPEGKLVYIDEKIPQQELKGREFIQYILVNKDLNVPESVLSVHIAHATTICAMKEHKKSAFNVWFNDNQKIIILEASQEKMEQLESVAYGIRDTGHNDIPKNSLIALSLGVMPKDRALRLTEGCTLRK